MLKEFRTVGRKTENTRNIRGQKQGKSPMSRAFEGRISCTEENEFQKKTAQKSAVFQWRMKKISSFISSPAGVFGLSRPLLLASISLILEIICITFIPEKFFMPATQSLTYHALRYSSHCARASGLFFWGQQQAIMRFWK